MAIDSIRLPLTPSGVNGLAKPAAQPPADTKSGSLSFDQVLQSLNDQQNQSDSLMQKLAAGEEVDLPQIMIATEQTDISFRVAMAIRDRLVEAYRDVTHITV